MTNHEIIQMLGGIEAVDTHIRELAETIAAERNMTVDELLNVLESEGYEMVE